MKTYINNVLPKKVSDLVDDSGHYTKPSGGIPASDLADGVVPVEDVQVNGTSILSNGVANVPIATASKPGVVLVSGYGLQMQSNGNISTKTATSTEIKAGSRSWEHISPNNQHESTFYGLAKAAGDTTQATSSNAVGAYTQEAKTAIKSMLGVEKVITISGTAPTITAEENARYICGEVVSLNFTPSTNGICDVRFTSGSTVITLTIPSTVKFPNWFDPTKLETNTVYEINVLDGIYGAVMTWAV